MDDAIIVVIITIALCIFIGGVCYNAGSNSVRTEAVVEGHAEYFLNQNYKKEWRWLDHESEVSQQEWILKP